MGKALCYNFIEELRNEACQRAAELMTTGMGREALERDMKRWVEEETASREMNALLEICAMGVEVVEVGGRGGREKTINGSDKK